MRMVGHTVRYGVQRGVGVCSVLRNMCSLCRKGRAGSLVSGSQPLCPPKIGVTSPQGGGGMTNGNVKTENGNPSLAAHLYRPLRPSGTSPNLGEESGCGLTYRFQVLGTPLLCPSESGGRGAKLRRGYVSPFPAHPLIALFCYIPPPLRSSPYLRGTELRYDKRKTERGKRES